MRNYITLNGKNSNEINGLLIQELPPISKPQIRTEVEEIDGRDGDIVTKLGFAAYDKEFTVGLYKDFDINAIIAYFNSEGTVVFSNEPDKYYNYQIIDQIDFERLVRYRTATVRMHCQPFKYSNTEGARTLGNKGTASGEGSFITLDNTPEAQFSKIEPKGNAEQTTYSGKNLLNAVGNLRSSGQGLNYTATADGGISWSGTPTTTWSNITNDFAVSLPAGTYTFSINRTLSHRIYLFYTLADNTTGYWIIGANALKQTATFTQAITSLRLDFSQLTENVAYSGTIYPMIEAGSTATTFERYVGGTPAPNPDYPQPISTTTGENAVKITGKNLLGELHNNYGIYATDGTVMQVANRFALVARIQEGQTYTASRSAVGTSTYFWAGFFAEKPVVGSQSITFSDMGASTLQRTLTAPSGAKYCAIFYGAGTSPDSQLELGSTTSQFEPYQGQEFEVNLGKNLVYTGDRTNQGITFAYNATTGETSVSGTASTTYANALQISQYLPAGTYTVSIQDTLPFTVGIGTRNSANTRTPHGITAGNKSLTFTLTEPAFAYDVYLTALTSGSQINATFKLQVERGSSASSFAPYFAPIELAKIGSYQDRIYKTDGKWYIEKQVGKVVLDGSEADWTTAGQAYYLLVDNAKLPANIDTTCDAISDHFTPNKFRETYNGRADYSVSISSTNSGLAFGYYSITSLANFKTWLASNPTTVYYALATPTTTEITNEALIAQLEALYNQAHAYKGRTHVAAIAQGSNAPHIIEAEVQRSSDGNITNNGNIVSKPTLTIYGSGNIGVSLNGYQILEITLGDEEYITIDTAAMEAYKDTLDNLKNRLVNGDYSKFALRPGSNMIEFSGTVSKCVISKYSRWL